MKYNMKRSEKVDKDEGISLVSNIQKNVDIVLWKVVENLTVADELKKVNSIFEVEMVNSTTMEVFSTTTIKIDDGYLFYEDEVQVIT